MKYLPILALLLSGVGAAAAEGGGALPAPAYDPPAQTAGLQTVVLSGGCFWGVQGVFEHVRGVTRAVSGYTGGANPPGGYENVSTGETGHAEAVAITYDPRAISYGRLLQVFFSVALDPTQKDAQGPDEGTQYRSDIWTATPGEREIATRYIAQLEAAHLFPAPIATRVDPAQPFYPAEGYHQDYLVRHPDNPYIAVNDAPKVAALRKLFPALYREDPVLASAGRS